MDAARKRAQPAAPNGAAVGAKRLRETESFQPGIGSKSKPCMKFFSIAGCPFGEGCHFLHYFPGGFQAVQQMTNLGNPSMAPPARNPMPPPPIHDGPPAIKTRLCNKFNTAEGCKFGDKCHFAHGERELGKPSLPSLPSHDGPMAPPPLGARMPGRFEPPPPANPVAASFGASATAKISVDASLAGAIIGKGGINTKQICRLTGVKLAIRDHETDANLRNIELEGNFDQIKQASAMVRELLVNVSQSSAVVPARNPPSAAPAGPGSNYKTKLCENFAKGSCTFGDKCHFAHGPHELRKGIA